MSAGLVQTDSKQLERVNGWLLGRAALSETAAVLISCLLTGLGAAAFSATGTYLNTGFLDRLECAYFAIGGMLGGGLLTWLALPIVVRLSARHCADILGTRGLLLKVASVDAYQLLPRLGYIIAVSQYATLFFRRIQLPRHSDLAPRLVQFVHQYFRCCLDAGLRSYPIQWALPIILLLLVQIGYIIWILIADSSALPDEMDIPRFGQAAIALITASFSAAAFLSYAQAAGMLLALRDSLQHFISEHPDVLRDINPSAGPEALIKNDSLT